MTNAWDATSKHTAAPYLCQVSISHMVLSGYHGIGYIELVTCYARLVLFSQRALKFVYATPVGPPSLIINWFVCCAWRRAKIPLLDYYQERTSGDDSAVTGARRGFPHQHTVLSHDQHERLPRGRRHGYGALRDCKQMVQTV